MQFGGFAFFIQHKLPRNSSKLLCVLIFCSLFFSIICGMYVTLFNHLPAEGHLGYFQFLVIMSKTAMKCSCRVFVLNMYKYPRVQVLGQMHV